MLLDIILSRGTDFNAKCQIRCRWLGGFFYANEIINILMICLHKAWVCFNIPEKVCVCLPPHRHRDGAPRGKQACVGSTGAPHCFTAGSNTKEQQECLWTPPIPEDLRADLIIARVWFHSRQGAAAPGGVWRVCACVFVCVFYHW